MNNADLYDTTPITPEAIFKVMTYFFPNDFGKNLSSILYVLQYQKRLFKIF